MPDSTPDVIAPHGKTATVTFRNNNLLPMLYGEQDGHLQRIEKKMGVLLVSRGNTVAIQGQEEAVNAAKKVLEALYHKLERGVEISSTEVDAALRMVNAKDEHTDEAARMENMQGKHGIRTLKKTVFPQSHHQANYIQALEEYDLVFGMGPAGTGKTYLAVAQAVHMFTQHKVERIILSRPAVEAGEKLGFLPGDLKEKVDPYLRPLYDALHDMLPAEKIARALESGEIEIAPLAFMRGRTLANAFVILDEAQNATPVQMKMFLTRLGENSRMVVTGDLSQVDLPRDITSGLRDVADKLEGVEGIAMIRFTEADVVRHPLVARIIKAYDAAEKKS